MAEFSSTTPNATPGSILADLPASVREASEKVASQVKALLDRKELQSALVGIKAILGVLDVMNWGKLPIGKINELSLAIDSANALRAEGAE